MLRRQSDDCGNEQLYLPHYDTNQASNHILYAGACNLIAWALAYAPHARTASWIYNTYIQYILETAKNYTTGYIVGVYI